MTKPDGPLEGWSFVKDIAGKAWLLLASVATVLAGIATIIGFLWPGTVTDVVSDLIDVNTDIKDKIATLPDAEKSDPIKELVARGYVFRTDEFKRAIRSEDVKSVELFCRAGPEGWLRDRYLLLHISKKNRAYEMLQDCAAVDLDFFCSMDSYYHFEYVQNPDELKNRYTDVCGRGAFDNIDRRIREREEAQQMREIQKKAEDIKKCGEVASELRARIRREKLAFYGDQLVIVGIEREMDQSNDSPSSYDCSLLGVSLGEIWQEEAVKDY